MNHLILATAAVSAVLTVAPVSKVHAQSARDIVGTWTLVSSIAQQNGANVDTFGPTPNGTLVFGSDGRYALIFLRSDLPKIASKSRMSQTPDEARAIAQGQTAHFGTYAVIEADKVVVFHIEHSNFPNWDNTEQRRAVAIKGDMLTYTSPGSTGVAAQVIMRRTK